jgi:hypothetical protein
MAQANGIQSWIQLWDRLESIKLKMSLLESQMKAQIEGTKIIQKDLSILKEFCYKFHEKKK